MPGVGENDVRRRIFRPPFRRSLLDALVAAAGDIADSLSGFVLADVRMRTFKGGRKL